MDPAAYIPSNELRMILIGKTGSGKSRTGNSILGKHAFDFSHSAKSKTNEMRLETTYRFERKIDVIDTPGLHDNNLSQHEVEKEIYESIVKASPGPHAILVCIKADRITNEDIDTIEKYIEFFGKELYEFATVIFTNFDGLEQSYADAGESGDCKENFIESLQSFMKNFLEKCDNRYIFLNNRIEHKKNEKEIKNVLDKCIIREGDHYVDKYYIKVTEEIENEICRSLLVNKDSKNAYEEREKIKQDKSFLQKIFSIIEKLRKFMKR